MKIKLHVLKQKPIKLTVLPQCSIGLHVEGEFYGNAPAYDGQYVYTPSEQTQTVPIGGYKATRNITINPIPSNYGRIAWNGSVLTVF